MFPESTKKELENLGLLLVASQWTHARERKLMVGLAGFEPAISWVPGETDCSQATRIVRTHRGYCPLDLAIRQPLVRFQSAMLL